MAWVVEFVEEFDLEFDLEFYVLLASVQDELLAQAAVIGHFGPGAGRPRVDTLSGSRHANMNQFRFDAHLKRIGARRK